MHRTVDRPPVVAKGAPCCRRRWLVSVVADAGRRWRCLFPALCRRGREAAGVSGASVVNVLTVASLNLHAGMDRHHVPFDVVEACRSLDSDVLVLQEAWWPVGGAGHVAAVAAALGYDWRWVSFGTGVMVGSGATGRAQLRRSRRSAPTVLLDRGLLSGATGQQARSAADRDPGEPGERGSHHGELGRRAASAHRGYSAQRGQLGLAVLSRLPVLSSDVISLPQLARDRARRAVLVVGIEIGGTEVQVVAVHAAHLSQGSIWHYKILRAVVAGGAVRQLVVGDMNLWGPVVERLLPGWHRTVVGRTWPAHAPVAQPDHILTASGFQVVQAAVCAPVGSDHRPIRVELALV